MSSLQPAQSAQSTDQPKLSPLGSLEHRYRAALAAKWLALFSRSAIWMISSTTFLLWLRAGSSLRGFVSILLTMIPVGLVSTYFILSAKRSILITPSRAPLNSSISALFSSSLSSRQSLWYILVHGASGAALAVVYALALQSAQPSTELGMFAATPRHPYHLNERFLFLTLGNALMMTILAIWDLLARRLVIQWPTKKTPLAIAVQNGLIDSLPLYSNISSMTLSQMSLITYCAVYFMVRKRVVIWSIWLSLGTLRPFIVNFAKPSRSLSILIISHLFILQLITVIAARIPPVQAITPYLTLPLNFDIIRRRSTQTPDQTIVTALRSKNPYYLHFTLMELLRISQKPQSRQALFNSSSKTQPSILAIWEELLLHLGRAHHTLITRGGARLQSSTPTSQPAPVRDAHTVQIRQANIFRPASAPKSSGISSTIQSALEGPVQSTPPAIVARVQGAASNVAGQAESKAIEWSGEVMGRVEKSEAGGKVLKEARGFWARLGSWVGGAWVDRHIQASLPEVVIIDRIMEIFATLACASLEEDTYGYVQQVLPATLEVIVRHRSALMSFESELMMNAGSLSRGNERAKADIQARLRIPISACEKAVRRIADEFGDSLSAFKFPPAIGSALTAICHAGSQPS